MRSGGSCASCPSQRWWGPVCGTGMSLLSPGRLWWEAQRGQPSVSVLRGMLAGHFDLGTTWKWERCSLAWIDFPGQIIPVLSQGSGSPMGPGRLHCFSSSNSRFQAGSLQPLPSSPSIPLPSLLLDHIFTCRVAGIKFNPVCSSFVARALEHLGRLWHCRTPGDDKTK